MIDKVVICLGRLSIRLFLIFIAFILVFSLISACSKDQEKKEKKEESISAQLYPVLSVQQKNDGIHYLLALENQSNHTVTLTFDSSKMFDITVTDTAGNEKYRHSKGKKYNQDKEKVQINAGASHLWKAVWKLSPEDRKAGIYKVKATFNPSKVSPGTIKTENLSVTEILTLQSGLGDIKNNSFRNIHFTGNDGEYKVSGEARVFEASFVYSVSDGHEVFVEKHEQTSEGAPAWAPFSFEIKVPEEDLPINGTLMLELFYFSPKDGEKTDVLAIPLETFK
jgi:Intracellular proteinase inhibitor/Immunoglobulin-like domain of bacterial spore germination